MTDRAQDTEAIRAALFYCGYTKPRLAANAALARLVARLEAADRLREALQEALNCKGPFNGTVSMYGGDPAICTRCTERARAALAAAAPGETEQTP